MFHRLFALGLAAVVIGVTTASGSPAQAAEPRQPQPQPQQEQVAAGSKPLTFDNAKTEKCIENPRFHPDNDEDGPRASSDYITASPYVSTPTASRFDLVCR